MDLRKYRRLVREVIDNICAVMTVQACSSLSLFLSLSTSRILRLVVVLCKPAFVLLARLAYEYGRERCSPPYLMALASLPSVMIRVVFVVFVVVDHDTNCDKMMMMSYLPRVIQIFQIIRRRRDEMRVGEVYAQTKINV